VIALLERSFDYGRIRAKVWYVPVVLLMPAVATVAYALMRATGLPLPTPRFPVLAPVMLIAFFVAGLAEELGWSGYVTDPLQDRWSALGGGIVIGMTWAAWHLIPLVQAHRTATWIAWWWLYTVGNRVLTVWLYNNTGRSVFAAALFHAMQNASWQLFPSYGSHWDPRLTGPIVAAVATVVAVLWGPRTLALPRRLSSHHVSPT